MPVAVLNRQAFAELKPEFPGEMTKLRLSVSLSREEKAEAKDEAPQHSHAETQRHCQANCSPGLAAAKPRLTKGPGEKLPCRHPAKAERRNAELLPAAISQSSRSNCCFYRLTWQGQKRGTGGGKDSWTRHRLSPPLPDTKPAHLLLPSSGFIWPQMSWPHASLAMPRPWPLLATSLGQAKAGPPTSPGRLSAAIHQLCVSPPALSSAAAENPNALAKQALQSSYNGRELGRGTGLQRLRGGCGQAGCQKSAPHLSPRCSSLP